MAKFIYKLQNILNLKYKLEDQAKTAFGLAQRKLLEEEQRLSGLELQKKIYQEKQRDCLHGRPDLRQAALFDDAVLDTKAEIKLQKLRIMDAEQKVEQARMRLREAMIERKTHEKLRENAFEEFKGEVAKEEKKEVDELVSYKYSHREERYG